MASYDIQTQQAGKWVLYNTEDDKESALAAAKRLFSNRACTGVRVLQVLMQPSGGFLETEILCETRVVKINQTIRFSQIDWAPPPCERVEDYYSSTSRRLMARVLRDYCDKMVVTPTELLFNVKEAVRVLDRDTLIPSAIDKVAMLQAGDDATEAKVRNAEISKAVEEIVSRARRVDKLALPKIETRFSAAIKATQRIETKGEDPFYAAMAVLARDLSAIRTWLGKVHRLCKLAEADSDNDQALTAIDGAIADSLAGSVVQDVLGYQPNLGQALVAMVDLAEGKLAETEKSDAGEACAIINRLCAANKLPQARQSLIDRVHRQLAAGGPLSRNAVEKERDEFIRLRDRLLKPGGLYQGPETAEALTMRYSRLVEAGGQTGRKTAFNGVFFSMPDRATSILYLCDIARTDYAKDCTAEIAEKFDTVLNMRSIVELTRQGQTAKERMQRVTYAHNAILNSVFPQPVRARLCTHLDAMLDRFLVENKLVEKLDDPKLGVKERAVTLAQFCGSGVLPPGKAMGRVLVALQALIALPDFDTLFAQGATDAQQAQKALQSFKQFVTKLGAASPAR